MGGVRWGEGEGRFESGLSSIGNQHIVWDGRRPSYRSLDPMLRVGYGKVKK